MALKQYVFLSRSDVLVLSDDGGSELSWGLKIKMKMELKLKWKENEIKQNKKIFAVMKFILRIRFTFSVLQ